MKIINHSWYSHEKPIRVYHQKANSQSKIYSGWYRFIYKLQLSLF